MPAGFPIDVPQNSGNMVHAQAPFKMFRNSVGIDFGYREEGYDSFVDFVNDRCSALIVPFANSIRTDPQHDHRGAQYVESLSKYEVPIIPFGLGAQAPHLDLAPVDLGPGMQSFIRFLSDRASAISVRGHFTASLFEKYGSTERVYVTGCPSFYSHPEAFEALRGNLGSSTVYERVAFAGNLHHQPVERQQLYRAIEQDLYLIEPVNGKLHQFYLDCINDREDLTAAYFLAKLLKSPGWDMERLKAYMVRRYVLPRDLDSWMEFNREAIQATIGTRFHVNMASILSGIPARWVAHDARTMELCQRLSLPYVLPSALEDRSYRELVFEADYEPMFRHLDENFEYFNEFLSAAGLSEIPTPTLSSVV